MRARSFFKALSRGLAARAPEDEHAVGTLRPAAVLAPFFEEGGEAGVLLVERSRGLQKHAGQLAFPGGGRDPCENDLEAALREAREEIGLDPGEVEVLGRLGRRPISTGYRVTPWIGRLETWPVELELEPGEVASVLTVPVGRLIEPGVLRVAWFGVPDEGRSIPVDFFVVDDHVVWGATARMLREALEIALGRELEPSGTPPWEKVRW